jgi:hypothetical protein
MGFKKFFKNLFTNDCDHNWVLKHDRKIECTRVRVYYCKKCNSYKSEAEYEEPTASDFAKRIVIDGETKN